LVDLGITALLSEHRCIKLTLMRNNSKVGRMQGIASKFASIADGVKEATIEYHCYYFSPTNPLLESLLTLVLLKTTGDKYTRKLTTVLCY
jgi:hypothetical protein